MAGREGGEARRMNMYRHLGYSSRTAVAGMAFWKRQNSNLSQRKSKNSLEQHLGVAWGRLGMEVPGWIHSMGHGEGQGPRCAGGGGRCSQLVQRASGRSSRKLQVETRMWGRLCMLPEAGVLPKPPLRQGFGCERLPWEAIPGSPGGVWCVS